MKSTIRPQTSHHGSSCCRLRLEILARQQPAFNMLRLGLATSTRRELLSWQEQATDKSKEAVAVLQKEVQDLRVQLEKVRRFTLCKPDGSNGTFLMTGGLPPL